MKRNRSIDANVPTLVDGGVCGSVDSATSYKRVLCAGRVVKDKFKLKNMAYLLDFENEKYEKGYEKFYPTRENIKKNIGKKICFVTYVDPHRGYFTVKYGVIDSIRYSRLLLNGGNDDVDIRDIKECGIEVDS